jgi:hypothetical protein
MEPETTWTIAKAAAEISKKLYELGKSLKDRDLKHQIDQISDEVRDLKHQIDEIEDEIRGSKQLVSDLEDENRKLEERLRFSGEGFEFRNPFWYEKTRNDQPLCPKCFSKEIAAPMGAPGHECRSNYRRCLVCGDTVQVGLDSDGGVRPPRIGQWS